MATILIIDDEEALRLVARRALEAAGHSVLEADNGRDAMAVLAKTTPDLVITDIIMPEQEGLQTIREIRKRRLPVKILAVSGGGRVARLDFLDFAAEFGADRTLAKPFRVPELLGIVDELLQRSSPKA